ncbi:MAG: 2-dehydropantoate 2-reductase [Verrucomicrobiota bacterium]
MRAFPTIAVVGAGAVGCYYGARLTAASEVSFLMRSDLDAVRQNGLQIRSPQGDFQINPVRAFGDSAEIGPVDLVLVAIKTTANEALPELIRPLLKGSSCLLTVQNGLGNEALLKTHFPEHSILGGVCFVCINRTAPGEISHLAHGRIELASLDPSESEKANAVAELFQSVGIPCEALPNLDEVRWRKLIWNIPFNGLSIAAGGLTTDRILADPALAKRTRLLMEEVVATAESFGVSIDRAFVDLNISRTTEMDAYRPSSLIDWEAGREVELESIWGEPLRAAQAAQVATPELAKLYLEIKARLG